MDQSYSYKSQNKLYITILAAGSGKRMNSDLPKVLHQVKNVPMIVHIIKQAILLQPDKFIIVVSDQNKELIKSAINNYISGQNIIYVIQAKSLGTGDAVKCTLPYLEQNIDNMILNGDVPLLKYSTIKSIFKYYLLHKSEMIITGINLTNPTGNGRILLNNNLCPYEIIEEKDCNNMQRTVSLVNCGIYIVKYNILANYLPLIETNNAQSEYYLTDLVKIASKHQKNVCNLYILEDHQKNEIYNINTKEQLDLANIIQII